MNLDCGSIQTKIINRDFVGWRGLIAGCTPENLFGLSMEQQWGEQMLGKTFEPARSRLLEINGYYRPMIFVRNDNVILFDGMNPALESRWEIVSADLGIPEAMFDWTHGTTVMSKGEFIYANRGITIFLNPVNDFVVYISVYVPTSVEEYLERLRLNRAKPSSSKLKRNS